MLLNLTPQTDVFRIDSGLGYTNDSTEIVVFRDLELQDRSTTYAYTLHDGRVVSTASPVPSAGPCGPGSRLTLARLRRRPFP